MLRRFLALALVIILSLPSTAVYAQANDSNASLAPTVTALSGKAQIRRSGGLREFTMYKGMEILSGDTIITGVNSTVTIIYERKEVVIGSCSIIYVNEIWERHERDISAFTVIEGSVKNKVDKHLTGNSRNTIQTANAIAGVRGTEFVMGYSRNVQPDAAVGGNPFTAIAVFDGTVRLDVNKMPTYAANEESGVQKNDSFLIRSDGIEQLHEALASRAAATETISESKPFEMKLENMDVKILEAIVRESNAVQSNPTFFKELNTTLAEKQETAKEQEQLMAQREAAIPQSSAIYTSDVDGVLPNLSAIVAETQNQNDPGVAAIEVSAPSEMSVIADAPVTENPQLTAEQAIAPAAETAALSATEFAPVVPTEMAVAAAPTPELASVPVQEDISPPASAPVQEPAPAPKQESASSSTSEPTAEPTSSSSKVSIAQASLVVSSIHEYTGQAQTPVFTVTNGTKALSNNVDYSFTLSNNINAGTATITLTGIGSYVGTAEHSFTITKASQAALSVDSVGSVAYGDAPVTMTATGGSGTGAVKWEVTNGDAVTISATTGVFVINKAGSATISVTKAEDNNYNATTNIVTFTVDKRDIADVSAVLPALTYNSQAQTPVPIVSDGSENLISPGDYTVSYADNINAGTASLILTASVNGNYTGSKTFNFTIGKAALTVAADNKSVIYGGEAPTYTASYNGFANGENSDILQGPLAFDCGYSPSNATGTYTITPFGLTSDNYNIEFVNGTLSVIEKSLSAAVINVTSTHTYTGSAQTPAYTVNVGSDTLVKDTDFTAVYSNNTNAGTAAIALTGIGNYSGTATADFSIDRADQTGFAINSPGSMTYGDSPVQLTASGGNSSESVTWSVTNGDAVIVAQDTGVISIEKAGEVTVTAVKAEDGNYNIVSDSITFTIGKRNLSGVTVTVETLTYTGTAQEPAPTVTDGDNNLISIDDYEVSSYTSNTGAGTAAVTITAKAGGNYTGTTTGNFTIGKAPLTVAVISRSIAYGDAAPPFSSTFAGFVNNESEAVISGSPEYSCDYTQGGSVGNYDVNVSIGTLSAANYEFIEFISGTLSVGLAGQETLTLKTTDNQTSYSYGTTGITLTTTGGSGNGAVTYAVTGGDSAVSVDEYTGAITVYSAGVSTITATKAGDSNYAVTTATLDITITPKDISGVNISVNSVTYDGMAHSPSITIMDDSVTLNKGTQYDYTFSSVSNAGDYTVTVNGMGNYGGVKDVVFKIDKASLNVTSNDIAASYNTLPGYTVTYSGFVGSEDETALSGWLTYTGYVAGDPVGTYTVTPGGLTANNYNITFVSGTLTVNIIDQDVFSINALAGPVTYGDANFALTASGGSGIGTVNWNVTNGDAVSIDASAGVVTIIKAGTATITAEKASDGNYSSVTAELSITVGRRNVSNAIIAPISALTYNGTAQTPAVSVTVGEVMLVENTDFSTAYSDNTNAGTATVTLTGIGNYMGTETASFIINKAEQIGLTITSPGTVTYGDSPIQLNASGGNGDGAVIWAVTEGSAVSIAESTGMISIEKTGTVTITASKAESENYKAVASDITLTVEKRNLADDMITVEPIIYNGLEREPAPAVKDGDNNLISIDDYVVASYSDNQNAGTASVTIAATADGNYTGTATGYFAINKASLTVTAISVNIKYGETPDYGFTFAGFVNGESESVITGSTDYTCAYTPGVSPAGNYDIEISIGSLTSANYDFIGFIKGQLSVGLTEQDALCLTTDDDQTAYVYGTSGIALQTTGGSGTGTVTYAVTEGSAVSVDASTGAVTINNVGTVTITATKTGDNNYSSVSAQLTLTVAPKNIASLNISVNPVTYDGTAHNPSVIIMYSTKTLVQNEDYTFTAVSVTNAGDYIIVINGIGNYNGATDLMFTINKKALSITAEDLSIVYGETPLYTAAFIGFANGESVSDLAGVLSFTCAYPNSAGAGSHAITPGGVSSNNYSITFVNGSLTVAKANQALLALTAPEGKTDYIYGDGYVQLVHSGGTGDGIVTYSSDNSAVASVSETGLVTFSDFGQTIITVIKSGGSNYNDASADIKLTFSRRNISNVEVEDIAGIIYNGFAQAPTPSVTDDSLITGGDYTFGYTNNTNAGTATLILIATAEGNYTGSKTVEFSIGKAILTVTAEDKVVIYRDNPPGYTYSYSGFEGADTAESAEIANAPILTSGYTVNGNVGKYEIVVDVSGVSAQNYVFTAVNGELNVNALSIDDANVSFSGGYTYTGAAQTPAPAVTVSGIQIVSGTDYTAGYSGNTNAGIASVAITGKGNYTGTASGSFQIATASLTVTAADKSVVYRDAIPSYTVAYNGFVNGESTSILGGTLSYACDYTATSAKGNYSITPSGFTSGNYSITFVPGTLTVTAKALSTTGTVITVSSNHTYNGAAQTPAYTVVDGGVTLASNSDFTAGYTNNTGAGTATITLTGNGNYTGTATKSFEIVKGSQAALSYTNQTGYNYGDAPFQLNVSGGSGTGSLSYSVNPTGVVDVSTIGVVTMNNAGSVTITVTKAGDDNYNPVSLDIPLTIGKRNLSTVSASITVTLTYNGAAQEPDVTFADMLDANNLAKTTDFKAVYTENVNAGTATVTLAAMETGNYTGNKSLDFAIAPKELTVTVPGYLSPLERDTAFAIDGLVSGDDAGLGVNAASLSINGAVLMYDATNAYESSSNIISFTAANANYTVADTTVTIYDGQAADRAIPVSQSILSTFKTYAGASPGLTRHYIQTGNLTLSGTWTPIGTSTSGSQFTGSYDGGGFTISGLSINNTSGSYQGLFGYIGSGGVVQNVGLTCTISGGSKVGGIAGYNEGTIQNCYVTANISASSSAGGIAGQNYNTIQNCYVTGSISISSVAGYAGGIAGENYGPNVSITALIENCYATASVTGTNYASDIGGIAGYNYRGNINYCYATGTISGNGGSGGILGTFNSGKVSNCVALNLSVSIASEYATSYGRIIGSSCTSLSNSYARSDMKLYLAGVSQTANNTTAINPNGASITSSNWNSLTWWTGTAGFTNDFWTGKLPPTVPAASSVRIVTFDVTLAASKGGLISLDGETWGAEITTKISEGLSLTAMAAPDEGYIFAGWCDELRNIVSNDAEYDFTPVKNLTLAALFTPVDDGIPPTDPPVEIEKEALDEEEIPQTDDDMNADVDMIAPSEDEEDTGLPADGNSSDDSGSDDSSQSSEGGEAESGSDSSTDSGSDN